MLELFLERIEFGPADQNPLALYTVDVNTDRVITTGTAFIFFTDQTKVQDAIALDRDAKHLLTLRLPTELDSIQNLHTVIDRIAHADYDPDATIVNGINLLTDFLNVLWIPKHPDLVDILWEFADHLTFEREYGSFLNAVPDRRQRVLDCMHWIVGSILSRSIIVR